MAEHSKAADRIVSLLREEPAAIPFMIGWLAYGKEVSELENGIQAYFRHQEQFQQMLAARKLAQESAGNVPTK